MPKIIVSLCDILQYVGDRNRPLKEGEAVFKAGHIILCGLDGDMVRSLCLQTSSVTSQPHEISLKLHQDVKQWKFVCSCKAGMSGFCKHIVATLIYINRHEDLELVSCTDLAQKWGKEKKGLQEIHKAEPFKDFCHPVMKRQKITFKTTTESNNENFAMLSTGVADSALSRFVGRSLKPEDVNPPIDRNFSHNVKTLLAHAAQSQFIKELKEKIDIQAFSLQPCCLDVVNALATADILKVATTHQGSKMWFEEKKLRITGSTCYSIYTYSKDDWENKSKKIFFPKHFETKFTKHGKDYEKEALAIFSEKDHVQVVTTGLIISKEFPWLGFSPDGVIFEENLPVKLVEIKCPYIGKDNPPEAFVENLTYLEVTESGNIRLKKNHTYYGQIQLGMGLLGLQEALLILYSSHSKTFLKITVQFDKQFTQDLLETITKNYFYNMLHFYCLNK